MSKGFMWKNMSEVNSSYRTEQLLVAKILREMGYIVYTEYELKNLIHDELGTKSCIPDIAIPLQKIIFRLNGKIHNNKKRKVKDEDQKIILQKNKWIVHDLNEDECPELWNQKKYTYEQAKKMIRVFISDKV